MSEITYRFSNCESTGRLGPDVNRDCRLFYKKTRSPIATNPNTLFQFEDRKYIGAQGFRLPKDGLYNITVAGASGGEGVCNPEYGRGRAIRAQAMLTTDYEYLILVGHKGLGVCDVPENGDHPFCQKSRPKNIKEAKTCSYAWLNWTRMFDNITSAYLYLFNGGGGGGGASMIWPRRADTGDFLTYPIAIGPGGGGASAFLLSYELFAHLVGFRLSCGCTAQSVYQHFTSSYPRVSNWTEGTRGYRPETITSGAGGGWETNMNLNFHDVDGKSLSESAHFAEGGLDCFSNLTINGSFVDVFGGFGGGGGGCGSGGGGGGYSGGHVIWNILNNLIPGSGGDILPFNYTNLTILEVEKDPSSDRQDGFVEIVASNCGCDGECVVYTEERQFECLCPSDTLLAEDGSSCYRGESVLMLAIKNLKIQLRQHLQI